MKKLLSFIEKFYVAIIFLILYAPIIVLMVQSFNSSKYRSTWGGFSFKWYEQLFSNDKIIETLSNTLLIALLAALLATVLGLAACLGLNGMKSAPKKIIRGVTNIPLLNADIVTGIAFLLLFVRMKEMIPGFRLGFVSVLISHITFCLPYVVLSIMPRLRQSSKSTYEAALDLGASPLKAFFSVVLPDIFPGIMTGFLLSFTMSVDDFVITYFTKSSGIDTISTMVYSGMKKGISPEVYALSTLMFLSILVILFVVNKISDKKAKKEASV